MHLFNVLNFVGKYHCRHRILLTIYMKIQITKEHNTQKLCKFSGKLSRQLCSETSLLHTAEILRSRENSILETQLQSEVQISPRSSGAVGHTKLDLSYRWPDADLAALVSGTRKPAISKVGGLHVPSSFCFRVGMAKCKMNMQQVQPFN